MDDPTALPHLATIDECRAAGLLRGGRSALYEAARRGEIPTVAIGRRLYVPTARLLAMLGLSDAS